MQSPQQLYEFTFPPKMCQIPSSSHLRLFLSFWFTTIMDISTVYYYNYCNFTITQSHCNWREVVSYYRFDLYFSDAKWSWVVFYKLIIILYLLQKSVYSDLLWSLNWIPCLLLFVCSGESPRFVQLAYIFSHWRNLRPK